VLNQQRFAEARNVDRRGAATLAIGAGRAAHTPPQFPLEHAHRKLDANPMEGAPDRKRQEFSPRAVISEANAADSDQQSPFLPHGSGTALTRSG
jgi:hypothetical protein